MMVSAGNEKLCGVPLGACSSNKKSPINLSRIVVVVLVSLALLVIAAVIVYVLMKRRKTKQQEELGEGAGVGANTSSRDNNNNNQKKGSSSNNNTDDGSVRSRGSSNTSSRKGDSKLSFVREEVSAEFDLQDLLRAAAEILGSGCHSSSYKAALLTGPTVVVKRYKQMNNVNRPEFQEHMRRLGRLNHPNLLPLIAYYYKRDEKLFITDYVPNGSLAVRLHGIFLFTSTNKHPRI